MNEKEEEKKGRFHRVVEKIKSWSTREYLAITILLLAWLIIDIFLIYRVGVWEADAPLFSWRDILYFVLIILGLISVALIMVFMIFLAFEDIRKSAKIQSLQEKLDDMKSGR